MTEALAETAAAEHELQLQRAAEGIVRRYLAGLGFGPAAIDAAAPLCVARAWKRVSRSSPGAGEELNRRAVEDAQRRIDRALSHLLGIAADDLPAMARARAALLLAGEGFPRDALLSGDPILPEAVQALAAALPRNTPPEAPRPMVHQSFSFFLRR